MTSTEARQVESIRSGGRAASELRKAPRPPHFQVVGSPWGREAHVPSLIALGPSTKVDSMWLRIPRKAKSGSVTCFEREDSIEPMFTIAPQLDNRSVRVVTDGSGAVVLTAHRTNRWFRNRWTLTVGNGAHRFTVAERRRDAVWRRTIAPPTKSMLEDWFFALIFLPFVLAGIVAPPNRLMITDARGTTIGFVAIPAAFVRPRENFSLYLDNQPYPLVDRTLALAAIAIVQNLR